MPGPISISYVNFSSTGFAQSSSLTGAAMEVGENSFSQLPTDTLPAEGGSTAMVVNSNFLADFLSGENWISLGWKDTTTDYHFGVKIAVPLQIAMLGHQPYYEVASGYGNDLTYSKMVGNPADPYTISPATEVKIAITTIAGHTSLQVSVDISNL